MKKQKAEAEMDAQVLTDGYINMAKCDHVHVFTPRTNLTCIFKQIIDCCYS